MKKDRRRPTRFHNPCQARGPSPDSPTRCSGISPRSALAGHPVRRHPRIGFETASTHRGRAPGEAVHGQDPAGRQFFRGYTRLACGVDWIM
jgi:hypothetical protein